MITTFFIMTIWAVLHSVVAGQTVKGWFRFRFGERAYHGLYRIIYNSFATLSIAPILLWVYLRSNSVIWRLPLGLEPLLLVVQGIGLVGLVVSLLQIDLGRFAGISQLRAYAAGAALPLPEEPLQTGGLYGVIRHPLYLFSLLVLWPVSSMTDTLLAFNIAATLYFVFGSLLEEQRLAAAFGPSYEDYRRRVPWLIPFLRIRR